MLKKAKSDHTKIRSGQKTFRIFSKMTRSAPSYVRMEKDVKEVVKKCKKSETDGNSKCKENNNVIYANKEAKEKKPKKKGWKRFRQAALMTCRYIGMGVTHMSPATVYSSPDYYVDPKYWNRSFSPSYNKTKNIPK
ncbi:hypothetical protein X975_24698, partial [Stegodyphus mimosarum]